MQNKECIQEKILRSIQELDNQNYGYFIQNLPDRDHWRLYPHLKPCFLDIETTGLGQDNDLTVIGLYDGNESKFFIKDINMDDFKNEIKKYDSIITFNGKRFDIPFIKHKFPEIVMPNCHIDLMYPLRELGYVGGLKMIEHNLGINREEGIQGMSGYEAVILWKRYKNGNKAALAKLISYNKADIENLKALADFTYSRLQQKYTIMKD